MGASTDAILLYGINYGDSFSLEEFKKLHGIAALRGQSA